jgi:hypothetical protein
MNHPEFPNKRIRDFLYPKITFITLYALFLAMLERRAGRDF